MYPSSLRFTICLGLVHGLSGQQYNIGMMLDEQLDCKMHSKFSSFLPIFAPDLFYFEDAMKHLPTSDDGEFVPYANKVSIFLCVLALA